MDTSFSRMCVPYYEKLTKMKELAANDLTNVLR